jgi:hypothetical protein
MSYGPNRMHPNAYVEVFPEVGGAIRGLTSFRGDLYILKQGAIAALYGDVGTEGEYLGASLRMLNSDVGCYGAEAYDVTDNAIVFSSSNYVYTFDGANLVNISRGAIGRRGMRTVSAIHGYYICEPITDEGVWYVYDIEHQAWTTISVPADGYARVIDTYYTLATAPGGSVLSPQSTSGAYTVMRDRYTLVRVDSDWSDEQHSRGLTWGSAWGGWIGELDRHDAAVNEPYMLTHRIQLNEDMLATSRPHSAGVALTLRSKYDDASDVELAWDSGRVVRGSIPLTEPSYADPPDEGRSVVQRRIIGLPRKATGVGIEISGGSGALWDLTGLTVRTRDTDKDDAEQ